MIEKALVAFLLSDETLAVMVSGRIYPFESAQHTSYPYIVVNRIGTGRGYHMQGPDGLPHPRIQVDCWGSTPQQAKDLADALRRANGGGAADQDPAAPTLDGFRGQMGGFFVRGVFFDDERDALEDPQSGEERGKPGVSIDLIIWYDDQVNAA